MSRPLGSPSLVLFPTDLERRRFQDQGGLTPGLALEAVCGFGVVASAARTAQLCGHLQPARVVLVGIAGTYDGDRHPVGDAMAFTRVALDGVGVGQGRGHLAPPALGFPQLPAREASAGTGEASSAAAPAEEALALWAPAGAPRRLLLSTAAASADPEEALVRRERHPDAVAEDMEGYAVALACSLTATPVSIVRGFSNVVGQRDPGGWRVQQALAAARRIALELLEQAP